MAEDEARLQAVAEALLEVKVPVQFSLLCALARRHRDSLFSFWQCFIIFILYYIVFYILFVIYYWLL